MSNNLLKEDSIYTNISFITYESNLLDVINKYFDNPYKTITNRLNDNSLKLGLSVFLYNRSIRSIYKDMLLYNRDVRTIGTGYNNKVIRSIIKDFIHLKLTDKLSKVINFTYKTKKNEDNKTGKIDYRKFIIYNFDISNLLKYSKTDPSFIKSEVLDYVGAFYHYSILYLISTIIPYDKIETSFTNKLNLFRDISEQVCRALLTGFKATSEFSLDCSYGTLYDELLKLEPLNSKTLHISKNPDKQTIEFKILSNSIFKDRYVKHEGYPDSHYSYFNIIRSTFRIIKGSDSNRIKLVFNKASGDETMKWIFRIGEDEGKTHPNTLYDHLMENPTNMMKFVFLSIIDATNYATADIATDYNAYRKFINEYTGKRYVAERIAVIALLAKHPELRKDIEKKFLTNKVQRNEVMEDVAKLSKLLEEEAVCSLKEFIKFIQWRGGYVW